MPCSRTPTHRKTLVAHTGLEPVTLGSTVKHCVNNVPNILFLIDMLFYIQLWHTFTPTLTTNKTFLTYDIRAIAITGRTISIMLT